MTSVFRTGTKRSRDFANDREHASTKSPLTEFGANKVFVETPRVLSRTDSNPSLTSTSAPGQTIQPRQWSQADQTEEEKEEKKRDALQDLVTSWMDRLQLISVITTFFAAMEAQLLGIVTPDPTSNVPKNQLVPSKKASAAALSSALVVHVFAAILSFIAAFFLVRFQLHKATDEEIEAEKRGRAPKVLLSSQSLTPRASVGPAAQPNGAATPHSPKLSTEGGSIHPIASATSQPTPDYYNTNPNYSPRVEQVGPWRKNAPPMRLLQNCHALCVCLAMAGFLFAITGVMTYVWAMLPYSSSIFCAVCLGLCVVASVGAVCLP